jgi:hypothetical protein
MSDYDYGYYDDQNSIDGKNYKKYALNVRQTQPKEVQGTHDAGLSTFNEVGIYLMPHQALKSPAIANLIPIVLIRTFWIT